MNFATSTPQSTPQSTPRPTQNHIGGRPLIALLLSLTLSFATELQADSGHQYSRMELEGAYAGSETLALADMAEMRGGFSFGGMEMSFGATLSTLIDSVKLETVFNISSRGAEIVSQALSHLAKVNPATVSVVEQTIASATPTPAQTATSDTLATTPAAPAAISSSTTTPTVTGPAASVTPATGTPSASQPTVPVEQVVAVPSSTVQTKATVQTTAPSTTPAANNPTTVVVGPDSGLSVAELTPVDVQLDGLSTASGFSGVVINNNKGFTAAVHKLTQEAAISAVISNASQLRVNQKLDIRIEIANAKAARQAAFRAQMSQIAGGMFR